MGMLENPKHEAFAQHILTEQSQADAYRKAYPHSRSWKAESAQIAASRLAKNAKVMLRVQELKAELASKCLWTREQSVEVLKEIATRKFNEENKTLPSKDADRIASIKELNAMHGFNAPIEHDVNFKGKHTVVKRYIKMDDVDAD
jgi:hypothetical protein